MESEKKNKKMEDPFRLMTYCVPIFVIFGKDMCKNVDEQTVCLNKFRSIQSPHHDHTDTLQAVHLCMWRSRQQAQFKHHTPSTINSRWRAYAHLQMKASIVSKCILHKLRHQSFLNCVNGFLCQQCRLSV